MRPLLSSFRSFRLHASRLREPLVQVWLMTGMALVLVIMGHIHAVRQSGDRKNPDTLSAVRLLTAGASFQWSDNFAPASAVSARPAFSLVDSPNAPAVKNLSLASPSSGASLDWRAEMTAAASRPWTFLSKGHRQFIGATERSADGLPVSLVWSGGHSGNAALNQLECRRLGKTEAATFVIGNGTRSKDGSLETSGTLPAEGSVTITLIGTPDTATDKQKASLGELLNYLEARFGTIQCLF